MRALLFSLAGLWCGCSAVYGPFAGNNPDNCQFNPGSCAAGQICDQVLGRCVPAPGFGDAGIPPDAALSDPRVGCSAGELVAALVAANRQPSAQLHLQTGCVYTLSVPDNYWYGPNGLPPITTQIEIVGHGAIIERASTVGTPLFRLFYVAGSSTPATLLPPGVLTLRN